MTTDPHYKAHGELQKVRLGKIEEIIRLIFGALIWFASQLLSRKSKLQKTQMKQKKQKWPNSKRCQILANQNSSSKTKLYHLFQYASISCIWLSVMTLLRFC